MQKDSATIKAELVHLMEEFDMGFIGNADIVDWFINDVVVMSDKEDETSKIYDEREKLLAPLATEIFEKMSNLLKISK